MKLAFKSYKFKKGIAQSQKWVIVLNNYDEKKDILTVINMPVTWEHKKNYILTNLKGQWKIKHLKEKKL